jgi:hypothetical protein
VVDRSKGQQEKVMMSNRRRLHCRASKAEDKFCMSNKKQSGEP